MATIQALISGRTSSGLMTWYAATLDCGHEWHDPNKHWEPLDVKVGDKVECSACSQDAEAAEWLRTTDISVIHHARYRQRGSVKSYYLYRLDKTSPSNFMLIRSIPVTPEIDRILDQRRVCALSPTEQA